jgi:DNA-binding CsgD family transcriptional regulator
MLSLTRAGRLGMLGRLKSTPRGGPGWRGVGTPGWVARLTLLGLVVSLAFASLLVWLVRAELTDILLSQLAARAVDQLELGILGRVAPADFVPPYAPAKLADLDARLEPVMARLRTDRSGMIRVNMVAADGTIIYSDRPSARGKAIPPGEKPELATALMGSVGSSGQSLLTTEENADLKARYGDAFEVYVPVVLEGRIVGAYEIYQDRSSVRSLLTMIWVVLVVWLTVGLHLLARWVAASSHEGCQWGPAPTGLARGPLAGVLVAPDAGGGLTPRELDVLRLMATSHSYRDIARELVVSEQTVRTHAKSVLRKLGQHDRARAVVIAVANGILQVPADLAEPANDAAQEPPSIG